MIKPKKSVVNMDGYFVPMFENNWDIKIDSNENNYGPSLKVTERLKNIDYKNISFYPFYGELTQKIAQYTGFSSDNIKVTNGADEALGAIFQTYMEDGGVLLTLDASFDMPVIYASVQGGRTIKVPFKEKWVFPVDEFLNSINDADIIYIASPNNPTGSIIEENDLLKIVNKAKDKVIIIDETYANYMGKSYKDLVNKYDNIFIVRSFSKDFALAGLRLGYIISNPENIKVLKKVVSPFSVNSIAMIAGIEALSDLNYFEHIKAEVIQSKEELKKFFKDIGAVVYDSYANFLLIDFKQKADFVYNKLKKENISVKLFKKGSLLENHLRVTIPTVYGVKRIKEALKVKPALVFDMDGVLIDARKSYRATIEQTYEKYSGKKIDPKEIQYVKNLGGYNNDWDLTMYLLDKAGVKVSYDDIVETFQNIYWNNGKGLINNESVLFDRKLMQDLSKNYNISIFTGRFKNEAMFALNRFNVTDLFYPIITSDDIPHDKGKPDPWGLNLTKEITIADKYYYFGDTIDDIKAAKSAGYTPIGVLPPQDKSDELASKMKNTGAYAVIDSVENIKSILEKQDETVL